MSKMEDNQEKVEAQPTDVNTALTPERQEVEPVKETAQEGSDESIGWTEGMAGEAPEDSQGWVEGMAAEAPENSIGWAEGLTDEAPEDTEGWVEGYGPAETSPETEIKRSLQSGDNLLGKPVINLKNGQVVGTVKEFFLDRTLEFITGVQLGSEGLFDFKLQNLFKPKFQLIRSDQIALFGFDVILATNSEAVVTSDQVAELEQWLKLSDLKGRKVYTPGGTHIGTIGDIIFEPGQTGRILGFTLSGVFVDGPLTQARAVAREVVVDPGSEDHFMAIDLAKAEQQDLSAAFIK